jgi:hypothetical protein
MAQNSDPFKQFMTGKSDEEEYEQPALPLSKAAAAFRAFTIPKDKTAVATPEPERKYIPWPSKTEVKVTPASDNSVEFAMWASKLPGIRSFAKIMERNALPIGSQLGYWDIDVHSGFEDNELDKYKKIYDTYEDKEQFFKDYPNYEYALRRAKFADKMASIFGFPLSQLFKGKGE